MTNNERAKEMAKKLDITVAEALDIIAEDKAIDRMKMSFVNNDITESQKKVVKKYSTIGRGKDVKGTDAYGKKRTRTVKLDDTKIKVIDTIAKVLADIVDEITVVNAQKTISFKIGADDFEIDLKKKRKPKA